jgi:hypothetical protein
MQTNVETLIKAVRRLPRADRLRLVEVLLRDNETAPSNHHLKELRGLGKDIWKSIDAQEYVDSERDEWEN